MAATPAISICLPVFNGSRFLEEAIESALNQSFDDFELIVGDDCSTDDSYDVIARYLGDSRLSYFQNQVRLGLFGNYNECMRRSRAPFIKLFAQDDRFAPEILKRMKDVLEREPEVALVSTAKRRIDADGVVVVPLTDNERAITRKFDRDVRLSRTDVLRDTISSLVNWAGEPTTMMFRREAMHSGFDCRFRQIGDMEYWYRVLQYGDYYYISDQLCDFRVHNESTSSRNTPLTVLCDFAILSMKYDEELEQIVDRNAFYRKTLKSLSHQTLIRVSSDHPCQDDLSRTSELWKELLCERQIISPDRKEALDSVSLAQSIYGDWALAGFLEITELLKQQQQLTGHMAGLLEQQKQSTQRIEGLVHRQQQFTERIAGLLEQEQQSTKRIAELEAKLHASDLTANTLQQPKRFLELIGMTGDKLKALLSRVRPGDPLKWK